MSGLKIPVCHLCGFSFEPYPQGDTIFDLSGDYSQPIGICSDCRRRVLIGTRVEQKIRLFDQHESGEIVASYSDTEVDHIAYLREIADADR